MSVMGPYQWLVLTLLNLHAVYCEMYIEELNMYLEAYKDCRIILFVGTVQISIEPPTIPIVLKYVPHNATSIKHLLDSFGKTEIDFGHRMIQLDGRKLFCTAYFPILLNIAIMDYICISKQVSGNWNWNSWYYLTKNVELIIFGKDLVTGVRDGKFISLNLYRCDFNLPVTLLDLGANESYPGNVYYNIQGAIRIEMFGVSGIRLTPYSFSLKNIRELAHPNFALSVDPNLDSDGGSRRRPLFIKCGNTSTFEIGYSEIKKFLGTPFDMKWLRAQIIQRGIGLDYWDFPYVPFPAAFLRYVADMHMLEGVRACFHLEQKAPHSERMNEQFYRINFLYASRTEWWFRNSDFDLGEVGINSGSVVPRVALTGSMQKRFATCNGVMKKVAFSLYSNPYDPLGWVLILLSSFLIIPSSIAVLGKLKNMRFSTHDTIKLYLSSLSSSVFLLIDVGISISDTFLVATGLLNIVRLIFGPWLLVLIVIVNAYKGLITSYMLSPLKPTELWTHISQLDGFFVFASGREYYSKILVENGSKVIGVDPIGCDCMEIGITTSKYPSLELEFPEFYDNCTHYQSIKKNVPPLQSLYTTFTNDLASQCATHKFHDNSTWLHVRYLGDTRLLQSRGTTPDLLPKNMGQFINEQYMDKGGGVDHFPLIEACEKTASVEDDYKLKQLIIQSGYKRVTSKPPKEPIHFSTGIHAFLSHWISFRFPVDSEIALEFYIKYVEEYKYERFQKLMAFGIYPLWKKWSRILLESPSALEFAKMEEAIDGYNNIPKVLGLDGNVKSIFVIWGILIGVTTITVSIELLISKYKYGPSTTKVCTVISTTAFKLFINIRTTTFESFRNIRVPNKFVSIWSRTCMSYFQKCQPKTWLTGERIRLFKLLRLDS